MGSLPDSNARKWVIRAKVIGEVREGTQQGRSNPPPGFVAFIEGRGGLKVVSFPNIQQVPPVPGCVERSGGLVFDRGRRFIVGFCAGETDPIIGHSPKDRKKEGNESLSITKIREKIGSELEIAIREDTPVRSKIRAPRPEIESMMDVTGPKGPIKI
jgi:hypothetical protein